MTNLRYQDIPIRENSDPMVEVSHAGLLMEPMYYNWKVATTLRLFMRQALAKLLLDVEKQTLKTHGLRFKIWDPWRPRNVQRALYDNFYKKLRGEHPEWDEEKLLREVGVFVTPADGDRIPPHATGGTVDLTLCDADGNDVNMGTNFDHFGPEAHLDYFEAPSHNTKIRDNRRLLSGCLKNAGLNLDNDEWWHYDFGNQKWALGLGRDHAFYGEVTDCTLKSDGSVSCLFAQA